MQPSERSARVLLLGPAAVATDGVPALVKGQLQVRLLALLAAASGRRLGGDELIDRLWPAGPPASADTALRVHIGRLRALFPTPAHVPFAGGGYALDAAVDTDLAEFGRLARDLPAAPDARAAQCSQALALWRGRPFDGQDDDQLAAEAVRLDHLRCAVEEAWAEAQLDLGRHVEATPDLVALVEAEPLRERRTGLLMLAHYRSGRQSDALAVFRTLRDRLADELGVDPGEQVRALELGILRQDRSLLAEHPDADQTPDAAPPRSVVGARPAEALRVLAVQRQAVLGPASRRLVQVVAVIGEPVPASAVQAVLRASASDVEATLAETGGLLVQSPDGLLTVGRRELADAVVATADTPSDVLHAAAAKVLAGRPDARSVVAAGWHLVATGDVSTPGRWDLVQRALRAASRTGVHGVAEALASGALGATRDPGQAIDLRIEQARAIAAQGRSDEASTLWRDAVDAARDLGDPTRFALTALARDWAQRSVNGSRELCAVLAEALDRLGSGRSSVRVSVLGALLLESMLLHGQLALIDYDLDALQADASELNDPVALSTVVNARHVLLRGSPDVEARRRWSGELDATAEATGLVLWQVRAASARLYDAFCLGDLTSVETQLVALDRSTAESRSPRALWNLQLMRASLYRERGDWTLANAAAEDAVLQGATHGIPDALGAAALHRLLVAYHLSGVAGFLPEIDAYLDAHPGTLLVLGLRVLARAQAGDAAGALADARNVLATLNAGPDEASGVCLGLLAEATASLDATMAAEVGRRLAPYAGQFLTFGQVSATFGPADRCLALVAWASGDLDAAQRLLDAAEVAAAASGAWPWVRRCASDRQLLVGRPRGHDELDDRVE